MYSLYLGPREKLQTLYLLLQLKAHGMCMCVHVFVYVRVQFVFGDGDKLADAVLADAFEGTHCVCESACICICARTICI